MKKSHASAAVALATGLAALLSACSSSGGGKPFSLADIATVPSSATAPSSSVVASSTAPVPTPSTITAVQQDSGRPVSVGRTATSFPSAPAATHSVSHAAPVPVLTSAVAYESVGFPQPYNCAESGTTYYKAPNVSIGIDVTVLVNSAALADGLTIAAPNAALKGLSNASKLISSSPLGHGVWRATYRTYASLYQPGFAPVVVSSLAASGAGADYTIAFPAPVSVTLADCHS